jgi:glycosyltransferase involved in cell wall biosynthesis
MIAGCSRVEQSLWSFWMSHPVYQLPEKRRGEACRVVLEARVVTGCGGGPEKTILKSPRFLEAAGYRTICAYMHPPDDAGFEQIRRKADLYGAALTAVPDRGPWDWRVAQRMLDICRREKVTLWHGHDYKSNALGLMLRPFWPMRLVSTVHGWVKHTRRTPLYYSIDRFCLRRYEAVLCVSEDLHDECLRCGVPHVRCVVIENGIDTDEYRRGRRPTEAKRHLGFPEDRLLIGAVGRLSVEKGFDLLIRATDRLIRDGLDVELRVFGEGDERPRLEQLIRSLGRADRIHLMGYRAELIPVYEALDVFALSSHREGLPNVVLEAMAMEVPVVATRIAGLPRLLQHGEDGQLIAPGDVPALTQALALLLRNPGLRTRLGHAARRKVQTQYSFAQRVAKIRRIYDRLSIASNRNRRIGSIA